MTPADFVRRLRCKTSILRQFCASFDVFSCGVLPESVESVDLLKPCLHWERVERVQFCDSRGFCKKPQDAQDDGSNSFQRNDDPLICIDEEKFCGDKIRLGLVSYDLCFTLRLCQ